MNTIPRDERDWQWQYGRAYQACDDCGFLMHVKYARCPMCSSTDLTSEHLDTRTGELITYTTQHYLSEGFETPLSIGLVRLDNGLKVFCPLTDAEPDQVVIGMRGRLVLKRESGGSETPMYRLKFQPKGVDAQ